MGKYAIAFRPHCASKAFANDESVKNINPRSDVLNKPVETIEETLSRVGAAAYDSPVSASLHGVQIKNLKASEYDRSVTHIHDQLWKRSNIGFLTLDPVRRLAVLFYPRITVNLVQ